MTRFNTGWVALPPTPRFPKEAIHRPDPDFPRYVMCGRVIPAGAEITQEFDGRRQCGRCNVQIGRRKAARKRENRRAARLQAEQQAAMQPKPPQPRGGSIRTVRGGLPGLGKR